MNIEINPDEIQLIKKASSQVETWHFNKYIAAIAVVIGIINIVGFALYQFIAGDRVIDEKVISSFIFSLIMCALVGLWLKSNWSKTDKEKAIDIIYNKIKENA